MEEMYKITNFSKYSLEKQRSQEYISQLNDGNIREYFNEGDQIWWFKSTRAFSIQRSWRRDG